MVLRRRARFVHTDHRLELTQPTPFVTDRNSKVQGPLFNSLSTSAIGSLPHSLAQTATFMPAIINTMLISVFSTGRNQDSAASFARVCGFLHATLVRAGTC